LLSVLLEAHVASDLSEALSAEPDVVLPDEALLSAATLAFLQLTGPLCGVLSSLLALLFAFTHR
jgi:hypothetical protein